MRNILVILFALLIGFGGGYALKTWLLTQQDDGVKVEKPTPQQTDDESKKPEPNQEKTPPVTEVKVSSDPIEAKLQEDFKVFRQASEGYLNSVQGKALAPNDYNNFLSAEYKMFYNKDGMLFSTKKDHWGNPYQIFINPAKQKIVVQSNGEGKGGYVLASYQQNGAIESCTRGFQEGAWDLSRVTLKAGEKCGGDIQP